MGLKAVDWVTPGQDLLRPKHVQGDPRGDIKVASDPFTKRFSR
jgi:hypothetical protein